MVAVLRRWHWLLASGLAPPQRDTVYYHRQLQWTFTFLSVCLSVVHCNSKTSSYTHRVSEKSSTSYFAEYFRAGLTDCKNFNGYRVGDNQ